MTIGFATVLLFALRPAPAPDCGPVDASAKPTLEIAGRGSHLPLALYVVGFSRSGRLAWLEERQGFDDDELEWSLHVTDLVRDRQLPERTFRTRTKGLPALCATAGQAIKSLLAKHGIEGPAPALEQPGTNNVAAAWKIDAASGERPVGRPKTIGFLRSPFEPREAVLVTQEVVSTEGAQVTLVSARRR